MSAVSTDVVVLGLGVHGSATAASLARRGQRVIGIEQFVSEHTRGSSHGRTRMIRRAYPNAIWNDFVAQAYDAWRALERESGRTLIHTTGGLYAHAGESRMQGPECEGLPDAQAASSRMPGLRIPDGYAAVYDPAAGVLEASSAIEALRGSARAHGADLRFGEQILGWKPDGEGVIVETGKGAIRAHRLVIAGGPWMGTLVPQLAPLLEVWRILTLTVAPDQFVATPPRLGAFSVDRTEGLVFGVPDAAGNGFKLGIDVGAVWDPAEPVAPATAAEVAELRGLMEAYVPGVDTSAYEAAACLYTMTEDRRFIIGALADTPQVVVVSACSGHGFKFGAAVGDAAADLATGTQRPDLDFISTARRGI